MQLSQLQRLTTKLSDQSCCKIVFLLNCPFDASASYCFKCPFLQNLTKKQIRLSTLYLYCDQVSTHCQPRISQQQARTCKLVVFLNTTAMLGKLRFYLSAVYSIYSVRKNAILLYSYTQMTFKV